MGSTGVEVRQFLLGYGYEQAGSVAYAKEVLKPGSKEELHSRRGKKGCISTCNLRSW